MLPEILTLKGFLSYREKQTLDFTKFHVALITGENGNGKSSILDAITFALFSMARGVLGNKKGLGDLVSTGDSSLSVSLQFVQDGSRFKVVRTHDKVKSVSNVFLQLEKNGDFVNISENTIRETDKKIEDIVHMNYETFITASFIMQGRSDYFTAKNPTERIEILREMLNLGIYEKARDKVKEKLRETEFEEKELSKIVSENKEEIKKVPGIQKELNDREAKIKEMHLTIDKFNEEIEALRKSVSERDKLQNERKHIEHEIDKLEDNFKQKLKLQTSFNETLGRVNEILSREKEIKDSYNALISVKKSYEEMLERSAKFQQLINEKNKIVSSIEKAISIKKERISSFKKSLKEIDSSISDIASKIKTEGLNELDSLENLTKLKEEKGQLIKKLDEANIKKEEIINQGKEKEKLDGRLKEIQRIKEERIKNISEQCRKIEGNLKLINKKIEDSQYRSFEPILIVREQEYERLKTLYEHYEEQSRQLNDKKSLLNIDINNLEQTINELNEKLDLISQESEDKCPLCGSPLSFEHKEEIKRNYSAELERNQKEQSLKKEMLKKVEEEISVLKVVKREEVEYASKKAEEVRSEISRRKSVTDELESQKANFENDLLKLKNIIEKGALSNAELEEFNNITANLGKFFDVEEKFKAISDEVGKLEKQIEEIEKSINELNLNASIHKANVINLSKNLSDYQKNMESLKQEISDTESLLASNEFMKEEYERISSLEKAISDVQFNAGLLEQLKTKKNALSKYENEFIELNGASVKKEEVLKNLARVSQEKVELQNLNSYAQDQMLNIDHLLEKFEGIDNKLDEAKKDLEIANKYHDALVGEKIRLEEQYKRLIERRSAVSLGEKKITGYEQEKGVLNVLDGMFGKEGIPVAVIRSVLPQIEMLSSDLLLRMTSGNMQIKFSTVKSGKSGDKNTFDIDVYDMGERRRYELFSGGEQFRINLAIRIGISLFLSSLSGTALEMLVIDEGLGSQDETGKERIIKEIGSIKDRFKKILVVTHIGDVKESFEYEIRVVKDSHTSRFFVV